MMIAAIPHREEKDNNDEYTMKHCEKENMAIWKKGKLQVNTLLCIQEKNSFKVRILE